MNLLEHPVLSSQRYESPTSSCFEIERNERPNGVFSLFSLVNPEAKTERTKGFFQLGPNYAGTGPGQGRPSWSLQNEVVGVEQNLRPMNESQCCIVISSLILIMLLLDYVVLWYLHFATGWQTKNQLDQITKLVSFTAAFCLPLSLYKTL